MIRPGIAIAIVGAILINASYGASPGPSEPAAAGPIAAPQDREYRGEIRLDVNASEVEHRTVHVSEHISGIDRGTVLLFPKWKPGNHSTTGPIERIGGLRISANGVAVSWTRDAVDMYAF